nr:hypothetical protein [Armatimonas sp.]
MATFRSILLISASMGAIVSTSMTVQGRISESKIENKPKNVLNLIGSGYSCIGEKCKKGEAEEICIYVSTGFTPTDYYVETVYNARPTCWQDNGVPQGVHHCSTSQTPARCWTKYKHPFDIFANPDPKCSSPRGDVLTYEDVNYCVWNP